MNHLSFDVLVIGAGASGLMAALEIAKAGRTVAVIEAKEKAGGRMFTIDDEGPVELGAEYVHGNLPLTKTLLQKAGAEMIPVQGSIWQYKNGRLGEQDDFIQDDDDLLKKCKGLKEDKPVLRFLEEDLQEDRYEELRFSLRNYVEGYYAADLAKASTFALCKELTKSEEEQFRVRGGYRVLAHFLEQQCREKGVQFYFSQPVRQLQWKPGEVVALTEKESFKGSKAIITVPVGVLQDEGITFFPGLPQVKKAAQQLGYGHVVKVVLRFGDAFWKDPSLTNGKDLSRLNFLFSGETIPTWWTHHPTEDNVLTGWLGGPSAAAFQFLTKEQVVQKAIYSVSKIFDLDVTYLQQKLTAAHFYNWSADPYVKGAYSYEVVGGAEAIKILQQPIDSSLFFAGEGLHQGPEIGTVEGALANGRLAANRLLASFS
jgi:monoamine oxidase